MNSQEFDVVEKEFLAYLKDVHGRIHDSVNSLHTKEGKHINSQLCLMFIGADTFSRFDRVFQGMNEQDIDRNNKERFSKWLKDFVLTEKNEAYSKFKSEINCDETLLWELRNSLLHFYGLPNFEKLKKHVGFVSGFGNVVEIERLFKEKGRRVHLIEPIRLINAINEGLLVQLMQMMEMIKTNPSEYIKGVLLAHKLIQLEGAVVVSGTNKKPLSA